MSAAEVQPAVSELAARACAELWSGTTKINSRRGWYDSKCPIHTDKAASAGVKWIPGMYNTGWLAFKCQAGCDKKDLEKRAIDDGILPKWERPKNQGLKIWEEKNLTPLVCYPYKDVDGTLYIEKWRLWDNALETKTFRMRQPNGKGWWIFNAHGAKRILYRRKELQAGISIGKDVFIVEGEKDVDNMYKDGFIATCNFDGGGKWDESYTADLLAANRVILIVDNDHTGYNHLNLVGESFSKQKADLYWVMLPGLEKHGDYSDFREFMGVEEFKECLVGAELWTKPVENPWPKETKNKPAPQQPETPAEEGDFDNSQQVVGIHRTRPINIERVEWWTDAGNGKRFLSRYAGQAFHTRQLGWLVENGPVFIRSEGHVEEMAKETARGILRETDRASVEHLIKYASKSLDTPGISRMLKSASTEKELRASIYDFDNDDYIFNSQSGKIDLTTGKIAANQSKYKCMKIGSCTYDAEAFEAFKDPFDFEAMAHYMPAWTSTLSFITNQFENLDLLSYLQEVGGYCLSGSVSQSQAWFIYGPGDNCKSQFLDHLGEIMGGSGDYSYSKTVPLEMFMPSVGPERQDYNFSQLVNRRLCLPGEVLKGMKLHLGKFKTFTGDTDKIPARFLNHEPFDYDNHAKLLFRGNYLPEIRDTDKGVWRRVVKVDFKNIVPPDRVIRGFKTEIKKDYPAMLAWFVRGHVRQLERGKLVMPKYVRLATEEFEEQMDADQQFINECLVKTEGGEITGREMSRVHFDFCKEYQYGTCNAIKLGLKLKEKGIKRDEEIHSRCHRTVYKGYAIAEEWQERKATRYGNPYL